MKKLLLFGLFFLGFLLISEAQQTTDSTTIFRIETLDGNEFVGKILRQNASEVTIISALYGEITLNTVNIKKIEPVEQKQVKNSYEVWTKNPQATRYFIAPNGYGLKKSEGYYQNVWVMFNQASYGFSNYFSVGVGMMPLFLFAGSSTPIWFTPKASIPVIKDKLNVGGGLLFATILGEGSDPTGLAYGVATVGNRDANLTFGMGYGFIGSDWGTSPVFTLGGMARVGSKGYLLTENYLITIGGESISLMMLGGRTVWPKVSVDYGLVIPIAQEMDNLIAIPWLGFVVPFGDY